MQSQMTMLRREHGADQFLAEEQLKQISRHVKTYIPGSSGSDALVDEINKLTLLLHSVLETSSAQCLSATHRVAAWNALCALIDQCQASPMYEVRGMLWEHGICPRSLDLYLDRSHIARPKSAKQLLSTLLAALHVRDLSDTTETFKVDLIGRFLLRLSADHNGSQVKASLHLLGQLLSKDFIGLPYLLETLRGTIVANSARLTTTDTFELLLRTILQWVGKGDLGFSVGQLVSVLLSKAALQNISVRTGYGENDTTVPIWSAPLLQTLQQYPEGLGAFRAHIFPMLFKRNSSDYAAFLEMLGLICHNTGDSNGDAKAVGLEAEEVLHAALQAGKELGMLELTPQQTVSRREGTLLLPERFVGQLLVRRSRSARVAALSLLVTSHSVTKHVSVGIFSLLKRNLPHFHADTDAKFRGELFSLTLRLVDRMRAAMAMLARQAGHSEDNDSGAVLAQHVAFLQWYLRFLTWELRPTASYQRHISALKCLSILTRSGLDIRVPKVDFSKSALGTTRWPLNMEIVTPVSRRLLLDLLVDPFDDVRQTAAVILGMYVQPDDLECFSAREQLRSTLGRAESMMLASGRADQADGVAHMYALLCRQSFTTLEPSQTCTTIDGSITLHLLEKMEHMLAIAEQSLAVAVEKYPLHGLLTSFRYVMCTREFDALGMGQEAYERLQNILEKVWAVVKPTLCNDAPEGYLPEELEDTTAASTKNTLSYCWRALKEASLLMSVWVSKMAPSSKNVNDRDDQHLKALGELCYMQLSELRHRGAFSTVAQTWVNCCVKSDSCGIGLSVDVWYSRIMDLLRGRLTINTRRSAGLPSLVCGVLIADKSGQLLPRAFADLGRIAGEEVKASTTEEGGLPQIHGMNCMKDMLKSTQLAEQSERFISQALKLAADALPSDVWAIRNCGLMLFRAVIDRLLGTNDDYMDDGLSSQRRLDFVQHPELLDIVLSLLGASASSVCRNADRIEGVFPALQLLQRARLPQSRHQEVLDAVSVLTASPSWHVRDKAARTYVTLMTLDEELAQLRRLFEVCANRQNALHGALLTAKYVMVVLRARSHSRRAGVDLSSRDDARDSSVKLVQECLNIVHHNFLRSGNCRITIAAYQDVHAALDQASCCHTEEADSHRGWGDQLPLAIASSQQDLAENVVQLQSSANADTLLERYAIGLAAAFATPIDRKPVERLGQWVGTCSAAVDSDGIYTSEAAARGLTHLRAVWIRLAWEPSTQGLFLDLCILVYDLLNDDDEDTRCLAAETAYAILKTRNGSIIGPGGLAPLVASERLIAFIIKEWRNEPSLGQIAFARAFNVTEASAVSVAVRMVELRREDNALFAEEKQNLYIDNAREVKVWSQVAMRVSPQAIPKPLVNKFAYWVFAGLATLVDMGRSEEDDALGWTSKAGMFTLGLEVIHGAATLLSLVERGGRLPVRPSKLRRNLAGLADAGRKRLMSGQWVEEIERVLATSAIGNLRSTARRLRGVESSLISKDPHTRQP